MSNPSIPRRAGKCLLCGGFLCGNLTEVYEDFTKLRFLTLHFFSILGNVNEVKKKESSEKGHKKGDYIMRKLVAAALVGVMTMGLTVCGVSADGDFDSFEDITVVSREDGSGTRGAFIELFGVQEEQDGEKVDMTTEEANITNSTSVMMTTVADDEYAIGYISLGSLDDSVKAVKIDGAEASVEDINDGTYKIYRPFNIATKGDVSEAAQDFINYIMSKDGQAVIEENKYISVG